MTYVYNDGGRKQAGYKGIAGDCGARAIAIALDMDYKTVYKLVAEENKNMGFAKSARDGVHKFVMTAVLNRLGWFWVEAPKYKSRKAKAVDLPAGTYIARQAGHFVAVKDGVPQDTWDSSEKMVYGYWAKK
jgi:hypothetical protein